MKEPLAGYLGKPISILLMFPPFRFWPFVRTIEKDLPERLVDYVFREHGISLVCDYGNEKIQTIFLDADCCDQALIDIPFSSSRREILNLLGVPSKSGRPHTDSILGVYGAWDRFDEERHSIHIEFHADADRIKMIALMRADVVP